MGKSYKSEVVDNIILTLENMARHENKHLIKTDTILRWCENSIDLCDDSPEREELLEIGIRQVIQSRLYAHGFYSVATGFFVNVNECKNLYYLNQIVKREDNNIRDHIAARNRIKELTGINGQMVFVPDENGILTATETKTQEEIMADLEADAI